LLRDADVDADMQKAAEYRLMRRARDFSFYLLGKVPLALRFGYNVLGVGEYEIFKLRSNYFYISDFYPKHAFTDVLATARSEEAELAKVRRCAGIPHPTPEELDDFFLTEVARGEFAKVIRAEGLPQLAVA
jgi:hypothetical protein